MSNGGIVGKDNTPSTSVASGVWPLEEQYVSQLAGEWPPVTPPLINVEGSAYVNSIGAASHTFSSVDIGTASAHRQVIVCGYHDRGASGRNLTAITIGGVSATIHAIAECGQTGLTGDSWICSAIVSSGTTGDIALTFSGIVSNIAIQVYSVQRINNIITPEETEIDEPTTAQSSFSVTTSTACDYAFIAHGHQDETTTVSSAPSEFTEDYVGDGITPATGSNWWFGHIEPSTATTYSLTNTASETRSTLAYAGFLTGGIEFGTTITQAALTSGDDGIVSVFLNAASGYDEYLFLLTHDSSYVTGTYLETGYTQRDFAYGFNGTSTRIAATSTTDNLYSVSWSTTFNEAFFACCLIPYNGKSFSSITFSSVNSTTPSSVSASAGDVVIVAILAQDTAVTFTAPSGYTLITTFGSGSGNISSHMGVAYKEITTTGTESPGAWGGASGTAADTHGCYTILLT